VFFLPVVPWIQAVTATCLDGGFTCPNIPGGSLIGYQSIGHLVTGWGAYYSSWFSEGLQNWGGYIIPTITVNLGDGPGTLTPWGLLFTIFIPAAAVCAWLLGPELIRNKVSRIVLGGFGAALCGLAVLIGLTMLTYNVLDWYGFWIGSLYGLCGFLMMLYSVREWPFGRRERDRLGVDGMDGFGRT
jgi:hypothetical protein